MKKWIIFTGLILLFALFPLFIWDMKRMDNDAGIVLSLIVTAKVGQTPTKTISFRFFNQYVVLIDEKMCEVIGVFRAATLKQVEFNRSGIDKIVFQSLIGFRHEITNEMIESRLAAIMKEKAGPPAFPRRRDL